MLEKIGNNNYIYYSLLYTIIMEYSSNILIESFSLLLFTFSKLKNNSFLKNVQGDYIDSIKPVFSSMKEDKLIRTIKNFKNINNIYSFYDFLCKKIFLSLKGNKQFEKCFPLLINFSNSQIFCEFYKGWQKGFNYTQNIAMPSFSILQNNKIINSFLKITSLDLRNLYIINPKIVNFERIYINNKNQKIFFVLGNYLSEDALAYSSPCNEEISVSFYILSEILQKVLKENSNIYSKIKKNHFLKNEISYFYFWKKNKTDFKIFILANAIVLKIFEIIGLETHSIESCLSLRGVINLNKIKQLININQSLEEIVIVFLHSIRDIHFQLSNNNAKILIKNTKRIAAKSIKIDLKKNLIPSELKKIFSNSDYLIFGEQHNFIEYYTFLSNLIPYLAKLNYKYIYLEEDEGKQYFFDEYIDGKNDSLDFLFFNSQKVLLKTIRDYNIGKSTESKMKIILYDINKTPCDPISFESFFQKREKLLEERLLTLLQQTDEKGIILCGATHACLRYVNNFSKNYLTHTFSQGIKSFCRTNGKNIFCFFSDAVNMKNSFYNYNRSLPLRKAITIKNIMNYKYSLKYFITKKSKNKIFFLKNTESPLTIINYLPNFYSDNDICKYTSENLIIIPFDLGFDGYLYFPFFTEI